MDQSQQQQQQQHTQMNTQLHISVLSSHNQANYSDIEIPGGLLGGGSVVIVNRQS